MSSSLASFVTAQNRSKSSTSFSKVTGVLEPMHKPALLPEARQQRSAEIWARILLLDAGLEVDASLDDKKVYVPPHRSGGAWTLCSFFCRS